MSGGVGATAEMEETEVFGSILCRSVCAYHMSAGGRSTAQVLLNLPLCSAAIDKIYQCDTHLHLMKGGRNAVRVLRELH